MSKNTSVALGEHFSSFITQQISLGRYGNASEVVRAGLRILEEHEVKVQTLRAALIEGEESGDSTRSIKDIVAEAQAELHDQ